MTRLPFARRRRRGGRFAVALLLAVLATACRSVPEPWTGPPPEEIALRVGPRIVTREGAERAWREARAALGEEISGELDLVQLAILLLIPVEEQRAGGSGQPVVDGSFAADLKAQSRFLDRAAALGWGGGPPLDRGREAVLAAVRRSEQTVYVVNAASAEERPDGTPGEWVEVPGMRVHAGELEPAVADAIVTAKPGDVLGPFPSFGRLLRFEVVDVEAPAGEDLVSAVRDAQRRIFADWAIRVMPAIREEIARRTVIRPAEVGEAVRRELGVALEAGDPDPAAEAPDLPRDLAERLDILLAEAGGPPFPGPEAAVLRNRLLEDFRRLGWPEARVDITGDPARPIVVVDPGRRFVLSVIHFSGLSPAEEREARALLPIRDGGRLMQQPFDEATARQAAAALRRWLREAGYSEAEVDFEATYDEPATKRTLRRIFRYPWVNLAEGRDALEPLADGLLSVLLAPASILGLEEAECQITLTFDVRRGPAHRLREVRLRSAGDEPIDPAAREGAAALVGAVAGEEPVAGFRNEIVAALQEKGLAGNAVETAWIPVPGSREWDVELTIRPGRPRTVASVSVTGAAMTDEDVLLEYVSARPGEPLDERQVIRDLAALRATPFVESVRPEFRDGEEGVDIVLHVEDRLGGQITPQGGFSFEGRPAFGLVFGIENFRAAGLFPPWEGWPVGSGERLGFQATWNSVVRSADLIWEDPRAISENASLRVRLAASMRRLRPTDWDQLQAEVSVPIDLGDGFRLTPGILGTLDDYSDLDPALPEGVRSFEGGSERAGASVVVSYREGEEGLSLTRSDRLTRVFAENPGWLLQSSSRARYDTELSTILGEKIVRPFLHLRLGFDAVRHSDPELPLAWGDYLRAGGPGMLRGFAPNGIGPTYRPGEHLGGTGRLSGGAALELRLPSSGGARLSLEPFLEFAALGDLVEADAYLRPSVSAGVSLWLSIPDVGISLGFHFGRALRQEPGDETEGFQFSFDMAR